MSTQPEEPKAEATETTKPEPAPENEAIKEMLTDLHKIAKQLDKVEDLKARRNELFGKLKGEGVATSRLSEASGVSSIRIQQLLRQAKGAKW
jgi:hypothetical protein